MDAQLVWLCILLAIHSISDRSFSCVSYVIDFVIEMVFYTNKDLGPSSYLLNSL